MPVAFLAADGVDQRELAGAWQAVAEAGGRPGLLAPGPGRVQTYRHLERVGDVVVDGTIAEADPDDWGLLVLPGGVACPDRLRTERAAVELVRAFVRGGRPVAAICHAPWLLAEADVLHGRTVTSWPSLRTDLVNAGATWVDEPVRVCRAGPGVLVTSRRPGDLPWFTEALVTEAAHGRRASSGRGAGEGHRLVL
ncbi:type 1 glutamine amidotransferase domain-containing protein [Kitasatospora sp. NPDC051853]|uniref:type 1 glutamine amidotransferase domain-containing protein n=1 Tax=Kitasatospora sp. NPDC051853 TaxID=3364058 RepID=UPI0037A37EAB